MTTESARARHQGIIVVATRMRAWGRRRGIIEIITTTTPALHLHAVDTATTEAFRLAAIETITIAALPLAVVDTTTTAALRLVAIDTELVEGVNMCPMEATAADTIARGAAASTKTFVLEISETATIQECPRAATSRNLPLLRAGVVAAAAPTAAGAAVAAVAETTLLKEAARPCNRAASGTTKETTRSALLARRLEVDLIRGDAIKMYPVVTATAVPATTTTTATMAITIAAPGQALTSIIPRATRVFPRTGVTFVGRTSAHLITVALRLTNVVEVGVLIEEIMWRTTVMLAPHGLLLPTITASVTTVATARQVMTANMLAPQGLHAKTTTVVTTAAIALPMIIIATTTTAVIVQ